MEHTWQIEIRPQAEGPITSLGWVRAETKDEALNYIKRCDATAFQRDDVVWPGADNEFVFWM
jgi:hypothetical protein